MAGQVTVEILEQSINPARSSLRSYIGAYRAAEPTAYVTRRHRTIASGTNRRASRDFAPATQKGIALRSVRY